MIPEIKKQDISVKAVILIKINDQTFELSKNDAESLYFQLSDQLGKVISCYPAYIPQVTYRSSSGLTGGSATLTGNNGPAHFLHNTSQTHPIIT